MRLREGEKILQIYRHHATPFFFQLVKLCFAVLPFFLLLYFFKGAVTNTVLVIANLILFSIFILLFIYLALIYWLDKLVITNYRIVHIDWKYLTVRREVEAELDDIQEIHTEEKGVLSFLKVFDYGSLVLDTSSSRITLKFVDAPNPESIRRFIFHVREQ